MPICCRTFPGNIPDSRSLDVMRADLDHAGFKNLVLITDRGHDSLGNVEKYILQGQRMLMRVKTGQREAYEALKSIGDFKDWPESMTAAPDARHYYRAFDIDYDVHGAGKSVKSADRLRSHLYYGPKRRADELFQIRLDLTSQDESLQELLKSGNGLENIDEVKRDNDYYKLVQDEATGKLKYFERDEKKVAKAVRASGFFTIMTHKLDFDSKKTFESYRLRDEQEKCFQQMKSQMVCDRQRNWSEEGEDRKTIHSARFTHFGLPRAPCLGQHGLKGHFLLVLGCVGCDAINSLHRACEPRQEDYAARQRASGYMQGLWIRDSERLRPDLHIWKETQAETRAATEKRLN